MDLPIRMKIIYNAKQRYAIPLKYGDKCLTFLTRLVLQVKASICSIIKGNQLLFCLKFPEFAVVVIIFIFF